MVASFKLALAISAFLTVAGFTEAQVVFQQNFGAGGVPGDYVGTGANQFDQIFSSGAGVTWSIVGNALQGDRTTANAGAFTRSTDLSLTDGAIIQLSVNFTAIASTTSPALTFSIGTGFDGSTAVDAPAADTFARFGISTTDGTDVFRIRNSDAPPTVGGVGPTYTGQQSVFWVVNTSASSLAYTGPNGAATSVGSDAWDIWVGTDLIMDEHAALNPGQGITDFKFRINSGTETVQFDNLVITGLAVPEPGTCGLLLVGLGVLALVRRRH